jgi:hypothetical protein
MARQSRKNISVVVEEPKVVKTPEVKATECLDRMTQECEWDINHSKKHIEEWKLRLDKNPASAFEWSRESFEAAARFEVAHIVKRYVEEGKSIKDDYTTPSDVEIIKTLRTIFYEDVLRRAKWPSRSTSVQSNEMELTLTARKAEWLEKFDNAIARIEKVVS